MYSKFLSYLKFILKSTNEHGVHSPFIFHYVTQCLYSKPKKSKDKTEDVFLKSIAYFGRKYIQIVENPSLKHNIEVVFDDLVWNETSLDSLYLKQPDITVFKKYFSEKAFHNDSMILVDDIYKNAKNRESWQELIECEEITVSIDLYHCGVLFLRKEQVKEHFTIRI